MLSDLSFREKSAWISFLCILFIFAAYFWTSYLHSVHRIEHEVAFARQVKLLVAFVSLEVVLHAAIALRAPKEAMARRDERERLIAMRSTGVAFPVLVVGALGSIGLQHITTSARMIAEHVLLAIVVAELVKYGWQILLFRRGA